MGIQIKACKTDGCQDSSLNISSKSELTIALVTSSAITTLNVWKVSKYSIAVQTVYNVIFYPEVQDIQVFEECMYIPTLLF